MEKHTAKVSLKSNFDSALPNNYKTEVLLLELVIK